MEEEIKDTRGMRIKVGVVNEEVAYTTRRKKVEIMKRAKEIVKDMVSNEQTEGNYTGSQYNINYGEDEAKKRVQKTEQSYLKKRI